MRKMCVCGGRGRGGFVHDGVSEFKGPSGQARVTVPIC